MVSAEVGKGWEGEVIAHDGIVLWLSVVAKDKVLDAQAGRVKGASSITTIWVLFYAFGSCSLK